MTFCALLKGLEVSYSEFFKIKQEESDLADDLMKKMSTHSNKNEYIKNLDTLMAI